MSITLFLSPRKTTQRLKPWIVSSMAPLTQASKFQSSSRKMKIEMDNGNMGETVKTPNNFGIGGNGKLDGLGSGEKIVERAVTEIVKRLKMLNPFIFGSEEVFEKCDEIIKSEKEICRILELVFKFFEKKLQDFWKKQTEFKSKLSKGYWDELG